jgi:hypothetical protein
MNCIACNTSGHDRERCADCQAVHDIVLAYGPGELVLVVDGSITTDGIPKKNKRPIAAGAGLVLARASDEVIVAVCAVSMMAKSSVESEYQAIIHGLRWAPVERAWSDNVAAIALAVQSGHDAQWLPFDMRDPLHNIAHHLADAARRRDEERLQRIWIPGEIW